ncbi:pilin [Streptomonospora nanhaiensis]|uniref:Pilin n=1 Tax=Streptomonospora nanhaiensis TaxID=1323731 RepID=A0ABY6YNE1_9ACTN|nr:pilin [Streptomonospora nanhaiensis]WAE73907.1 pilin [Streptomonospora nanhaiensis]
MAYERIPVADAAQTTLAMAQFQQTGNEVLGYVAWAGAVVGVLALIIIGGRMIHANFTGDPWIAARGMAELPWVVLGVVLLIASGSLAGTLLQGSYHETENDLGTLFQGVAAEQDEIEREAAGCDGALRDPETRNVLCPGADGWDRLSHTVPLTGRDDERCTYDGKEDCYEYCFQDSMYAGGPTNHALSPCTPERELRDLMSESGWPWAAYHCPQLNRDMIEEIDACKGDNLADGTDDLPEKYRPGGRNPPPVEPWRWQYICEEFPAWAAANEGRGGIRINFCPGVGNTPDED